MLFKLSIRNIKRSLSDYAIYFMTITLAVCLFYVFNSIEGQQAMLELTGAESELMSQLSSWMTLTSVVVSIVFFMLCLFANRFFIKRRKKEFGLYMSLGMGKGEISKILLVETIVIAFVALVVGIGLGTFVSQGMAAFTATLFSFEIIKYQFFFSVSAMVQTIIFFSIIFGLVLIFNSISISSYSLLDLLTASRKSETLKIKNSKVSAIIFIISIISIVSGYVVVNLVDFPSNMIQLYAGVCLVLIGTMGFYYSGMSFIITLAQKNKRVYFKGINTFNIRQISSKLTTAFASILVIHILLFFTMTILSGSLSYKSILDSELNIVAPYDVTLRIYNSPFKEDGLNLDDKQKLEVYDFDLDQFDQYVAFNEYELDLSGAELLAPYAEGSIKVDIGDGFPINMSAIRYSDYVKLQQLQGKTPVELKANETLILTNVSQAVQTIQNLTDHVTEYKIGDQTLTLHDEKYQVTAIETENVGRTIACFVIPDELSEQLESYVTMINIMYDKFDDKLDNALNEQFTRWLDLRTNDYSFMITGITKTEAYQIVAGETTNILYIGIYLGIVFLVSSGAVLGLRQLSDAADEAERYKVLRKIGVSEKEINKSIFLQVFIAFMTPLGLAIIHTIFTLYYFTTNIATTGSYNILISAGTTLLVLIVIYGGYMMSSYFGYKRIINK